MANSVDSLHRYGRKWTKWVLIYAAVGAVAYLVVYLILQATGGSGSLY
jgi:hypothetical protein